MGVFGLGCGFAQGMSLALANIIPRLRYHVVDDERSRTGWSLRALSSSGGAVSSRRLPLDVLEQGKLP